MTIREQEDAGKDYDPILNVDHPDFSELLNEIYIKILQNLRKDAANKRESRLETIFKGGKRKFWHEHAYYEELCSGGNFQVITWQDFPVKCYTN